MNTITELQALQNAADTFKGVVTPHYFEDKRKATKYILSINKIRISPILDYEGLNLFMLGLIRGMNINNIIK